VRIAVFGDSFAEAFQVSVEHTFWSVLMEETRRRQTFSQQDVEVLNFGISGHGTAQQLQMLRHHANRFDPDVVVLTFYAGNDVRNNSTRLEPDKVRPFFVERGEQLALDNSFLQHPAFVKAQSSTVRAKVWLINQSRLLQCFQEWRNHLGGAPETKDGPAVVETLEVFREPDDEDWRAAWQLTERLIQKMAREVQVRGKLFLLVVIPQAIQVHPEPDVRREFCGKAGIDDTDYADRRLKALGARCGFPVLSLAGVMRHHAESQQTHLYGFDYGQLGEGHWNIAGHQMAGEQIASAIQQALQDASSVGAEAVE
jgi:hypothetical protein